MLMLNMSSTLECVLNFSEGRRKEVIDSVVQAAASVSQVWILQVDSHKDANRTVLTFAGEPLKVCQAAFNVVEMAAKKIDMRNHHGTHSRIGAADVVPLVPVEGISLEQTIKLAHQLGKRIAQDLNLAVYFYAHAAFDPQRFRLPFIRKGEYEGLAQRLAEGFYPDCGPRSFQPRFGACAVGARPFMLAYNINIKGGEENLPILNQIAQRLRSSGDGKTPGLLPALQAKPWFSSNFNCCQMTANLFDFNQTGMGRFFEEVKSHCQREGLEVDGSELVGLAPQAAFEETATFYGIPLGLKTVEQVSHRLGLGRCKPFVAAERVFELVLNKAKKAP